MLDYKLERIFSPKDAREHHIIKKVTKQHTRLQRFVWSALGGTSIVPHSTAPSIM